MLGANNVACYFKIEYIYSKTLGFARYLIYLLTIGMVFTDGNQFVPLNNGVDHFPLRHLVLANQQIFEICQICSLCLNACLCIDLYITFKDPFKPSGRRLKYYFICTAVVVFVVNYYNFNRNTFLLSPEAFFEQYIQPIISQVIDHES